MTTAKPPASRTHGVAAVVPCVKGDRLSPFTRVSRSHDVAIVELLKKDRSLPACTWPLPWRNLANPVGSRPCYRRYTTWQRRRAWPAVAQRAAMPRESLYRALAVTSNPTLKTLLAVLGAAGLQLAVTRTN